MSSITMRQAQAADWPAVEALLRANGLPLQGAREHLATFVLAQAGGETVGCAGVEPRGEVALLRSVAVAPGLQRQGIGRQMVALLMQEARRRGFAQMVLLTTTARRFFEELGFTLADRAQAPAALQQSAEFQGLCPASADYLQLMLQPPVAADALQGLPVAVLGAGPVGLAAAAQLLARGLPFVILEAAPQVGASLLDYGHVRLFSPWRYNIDPVMAAHLAPTGWQAPPPEALPLAAEVVQQVLAPFARLPEVAAALRLSTRVTAITREGFDKVKSAGRDHAPFVIRALHGGQALEIRARAVIDATGTWHQPNPLGAGGLPAIGEAEAEAAARIRYGIPDVLDTERARYAGKHTLVVGAGHSAAHALLDLARLATQAPGTRLAWAVRSPALTRVFGGGAADALPARGALGTALRQLRDSGALALHAGLRITRIEPGATGTLTVLGVDAQGHEQRLEGIDEIVCATGQRPDLGLTRELRVRLDPWLESTEALGPLIDPNLHSCGTVRPHGHRELSHPEPGLYTVGVKSYGRAPTFLMATGFEQARSVVAALAGDLQAADRVELNLPETGVCSVSGADTEAAAGEACCGGPPARDAAACCVLDEQRKAEGEAGCGCATPAAVPALASIVAAPVPARRSSGCC
ncbi:arsenic resistance N-acetyltransferase ArsN2 [Aquabacterium sp. OR-4]|uniref:arsenic resistance N-acetyltransferase ArsN2 n=1 Tax=Aquabacterium sp. OR-4 TaxID=2978127 RepID=UPI0028C74FF9|nr:arsenic resistance N-acetyltransferase ArsN2 [Aquabacterium sp. OR-4]MDT7837027.1 arsenic resistance N-acetyltransferase ArsN2 [Aquabacterium sp. OR-4]